MRDNLFMLLVNLFGRISFNRLSRSSKLTLSAENAKNKLCVANCILTKVTKTILKEHYSFLVAQAKSEVAILTSENNILRLKISALKKPKKKSNKIKHVLKISALLKI